MRLLRKCYLFIFTLLILNCSAEKANEYIDLEAEPYSSTDIPFSISGLRAAINNMEVITIGKVKYELFNPYKNKGALALKGSMHNHSDNSLFVDTYGSGKPADVARRFRDEGNFDFYTLTDHNYVTWDPDTTLQGIVWMGKSVEDTKFSKEAQHLCVYNLPATYRYINKGEDINELIDYYHSLGAIVSYAHPDWGAQFQTDQKISKVKNVDFVEVLNSSTGGSERAYNILLGKGINVLALGVDDYHFSEEWRDPCLFFDKAYIVAYADKKEKISIWKSILAGSFYASTGASMDINCIDGVIAVSSDRKSTIQFIGKSDINPGTGKTLKSADNTMTANYTIRGNEDYIWVRLTNDTGRAFSQPFIIRKQ